METIHTEPDRQQREHRKPDGDSAPELTATEASQSGRANWTVRIMVIAVVLAAVGMLLFAYG